MHTLLLVLFAASNVVSGPLTMAVSTEKRILVLRIGATEVRRYSVAVGSKKHPTPNGRFAVRHIVWNPDWHPPDAAWARGKQPLPAGHGGPLKRAISGFAVAVTAGAESLIRDTVRNARSPSAVSFV